MQNYHTGEQAYSKLRNVIAPSASGRSLARATIGDRRHATHVWLIPFGSLSLALLALLLPLAHPAAGQSGAFKAVAVSDGLAYNEISSIAEDSRGYLWLATIDGLSRYDGDEWKTYRSMPGDSTGEPLGSVYTLHMSSGDILWAGFGQRNGLARIDLSSSIHTIYRHDEDDPNSLSSDQVVKILESRDGTLWIGTLGGGLNRLDPQTGVFTTFLNDAATASNWVLEIHETRDGTIWVGTAGGGIHRFDRTTGTFTTYRRDAEDALSLSTDRVRAIYETHDGTLWVGTHYSGISRFDTTAGQLTRYRHDAADPQSISHDRVGEIYETQDGVLWVGTWGGGVNRFDPAKGTFTAYRRTSDVESSLGSDYVSSIHESHDGTLWVATTGGLSRYDALAGVFATHRFGSVEESAGRRDDVISIHETRDGMLWVGTVGGGIHRIDRTSGVSQTFRHIAGDTNSLSHDDVSAIYETQDGTLWVGTRGGGINGFDRATGIFTAYRHDAADTSSLSHDTVSSIYETQDGSLWVGTQGGGLNRFDAATGVFTSYRHRAGDARSLGSDVVWTIHESRDGSLWIGTSVGLNRFEAARGLFTSYGHSAADQRDSGVIAIHEASDGAIWIASLGELKRLEFDGSEHPVLVSTDSYSSGTSNFDGARIASILEDDQGLLWLGLSSSRLARFNPALGHFRYFDDEEIFRAVRFQNAALRSQSGVMYFGGNDGVIAFDPTQIPLTRRPPRLHLNDIRLFSVSVVPGEGSPLALPIWLTKAIKLGHDQNDIELAFTGIQYADPSGVRYKYRLVGYDKDWRGVTDQRTASYTNLPSGTFTFEVKSANSDGYWIEEPVSLDIAILPPWWRTTQAYLLFGLLLFTALVATDRFRRRRLLEKERAEARIREVQLQAENAEAHANLLQELDQTKSRFFANISHEFRTPLTLILGPLEDVQDGLHGPISTSGNRQVSTAISSGRRLLRLVNQLLDVSRLESGKMDLQAQEVDMTAFVERLMPAFVPMAERKQIDFRFDSPGHSVPVYVDPEQFEKVLANLLGNAFKFTPPQGTIRVTLATEEDDDGRRRMVLAVRDNGPGIPPEHLPHLFERFYQADASSTRSQPGTGIGLALVKSLVELHRGTVEVESDVGRGTTFRILMPTGHDHLKPEEIVAGAPDAVSLPNDHISIVLADEIREEPIEEPESPNFEHGQDRDETMVLVVDDNPDVRAYVRRHLAQRYRVLEAADGRQALAMAREYLPDLVVSDVMMPVLDGFGLCRALKTDPELDFIPVVLLTAKASTDSKIEGLEEGADDYLTKPFNVRELEVRVENLIASRQRLKQRNAGSSNRQTGSPASLEHTPITDNEADFAHRVQAVIAERLSDEGFGVDELASALGLGRTTLYSRLGETFGKTPMDLIWQMRLERAAALLRDQKGNVSEVAYGVGFKSVAHFCNRFRVQYGQTPAIYATQHKSGPA
jgi:signal transduction histidine kinase/ligand-binding sensor domain-containing protein/CheY-like chemotaxis protein/AraC-like DNA-binding protein